MQQLAKQHQNQFPPLGTSNRRPNQQHKPKNHPRLQPQTIQTTALGQQQHPEARQQQQQSFQQQHQRILQQFQNDQQREQHE